jgi:hypothetical protein
VPNARIPLRPDKTIEAPATIFSISIENLSHVQPLRQVCVELVEIELHDGGKFVPQGVGGPVHLQWERKDGDDDRWSPIDIPPAATRYINVVSVDEPTNRVWIKSKRQWLSDAHLFRESGLYRLSVAARPIEGSGATIQLALEWTGDWRTAKMWEIDDGDLASRVTADPEDALPESDTRVRA